MNCKSLVAIALLAGCGPALADQQIASVQVTAKPEFAVAVSCASRTAPSRAEVEKILMINDGSQTHALTSKLMSAVGEACSAGVASIEVKRGANGQSLTWTATRGGENRVALN